jgi:putative peptide zinc metalloprotease protein
MPPEEKKRDHILEIKFEERTKLISSHPLFNKFPAKLLDELTQLCFERKYAVNEVVVSQDDIVNAVYFIARGEVEVDREVKDKGYCVVVPQAVLREGETIGLSKVGFFSETGLRTATLKAVTESILIGCNLDVFNSFLQRHPSLHSDMRQASEIMQRINFIKQIEPFAELPKEKLTWLSRHIEEITALAGTILFKMGDVGEECYLLRSGTVEITAINKHGVMKKLASLVPPMLFGEAALLTSSRRNATATMVENGNLLVIKKEQLDELLQHHSTTESMMLLSVERCRPIHADGIMDYKRKSDAGEEMVILKDTIRGKYFQLSEDGWYIWQHLDGINTLQDLAVEFFKYKRIFSPEAIADTIFKLSDAGFVILPEVPFYQPEIPDEKLTSLQQVIKSIGKYTYFERTFENIDENITNTYHTYFESLYTTAGRFLIFGIIAFGLLAFILNAPTEFLSLDATHHLVLVFIALVILNLLTVIVHEFAHALTTKYFKHEVRRAGLWVSLVSFIAFIDTSDMWLSDRRSKIIVSLAGPVADLAVAGLASITALVVPQEDVALVFWLLSLVLYYSVFKNLNPFMENDGYFVMKDFFEQPNLRECSIKRLFRIGNQKSTNRTSQIIYIVTCFVCIILDVSLAFIFQYYLRLLLPNEVLGISTTVLFWFIPSLVLAKYLVNTWVVLRRIR